MVLIDSVLSHTSQRTECLIDIDKCTIFQADDGSVPAFVALEYLAQSIAVHGGLVDKAADRSTRPGLLLGSRNLRINVTHFAPHQRLRTEVHHLRGELGLLAFECALFDEHDGDAVLASGTLTVYLLASFEALLQEFDDGE
jgi:predicted hotdog family 3-hydroxylacyl-ACP dehydratase